MKFSKKVKLSNCLEGLEIIVSEMIPKTDINSSSLLTEEELSELIENKSTEEIQQKIKELNKDYDSYRLGIELSDKSKYRSWELCLFPNRMKYWLTEKDLEPFLYRLFTSNSQLEYQKQLVEEANEFLDARNKTKNEINQQKEKLKSTLNETLGEKSPYWPKKSVTFEISSDPYQDSSDQYVDFGTFA